MTEPVSVQPSYIVIDDIFGEPAIKTLYIKATRAEPGLVENLPAGIFVPAVGLSCLIASIFRSNRC